MNKTVYTSATYIAPEVTEVNIASCEVICGSKGESGIEDSTVKNPSWGWND